MILFWRTGAKTLGCLIPTERIQRRVYLLRGERVLLSHDLAELYGVETRRLNEQVQRNHERFPVDFMFQLTDEETEFLKSQIAISNRTRGGRRYRPYAFTEQGVAMLSSVLRSRRAVEVNIAIMRTFVQLRRILAGNKLLRDKIERLEKKYDEQFQQVFAILECMIHEDDSPRSQIGFLSELPLDDKCKAKRKRTTKNQKPTTSN